MKMNNRRGESKTSPRRIKAAERQVEALKLRTAGATFQAIAEKLKFNSRQAAQNAVVSALRKTLQEPADQLRKIDVGRLDTMLLALWSGILAGRPDSVNAALRVLERRAKLLGLDMPMSLVHSGPGGGPIEHKEVYDFDHLTDEDLKRAVDEAERQLQH